MEDGAAGEAQLSLPAVCPCRLVDGKGGKSKKTLVVVGLDVGKPPSERRCASI